MGDDKDDKEGIGFSGISSLLPDDPPDTPAQQLAPAAQSEGSQPAAVPHARGTTESVSSKPPAPALQPTQPVRPPHSGGGAVWGWIGGIAVVVFLIWAASQSGTQPASQLASQLQAAQPASIAQPSTPAQDEQSTSTTTTTSQPTDPVLQTPPVGVGNVLSVAEIRYCLVLEQWVKAAQPAVDTYRQDQVDRFNKMVDDYNGRCLSFQYRTGDLEQAQRDVAPYARRFQTLSRHWVKYGAAPTTNTSEEPVQPTNQLPTPDAESKYARPMAATKARSQPDRTRRMASARRNRVSAGAAAATAPFDASLVHARQIGSCAPTYPVEVARRGRSGTTILAVRVGTDGGVVAVRVASSSGSPALDRAAVDAMEQCRFTPATRAGRVVIDELTMPVNFTFSHQLISPDATGAYH